MADHNADDSIVEEHVVAVEGIVSDLYDECALTVVVLGGSGDLAKKKTFPALFTLFCMGLLPEDVKVFAYARSDMTQEAFLDRIKPGCLQTGYPEESLVQFNSHCTYFQGQYDSEDDFARLNTAITATVTERGDAIDNRLYYLALPPKVFVPVSAAFRPVCWSATGWNRVIVEKPFGRDFDSCKELISGLADIFEEEEQYRIDHYLGKELVQNMLTLRFANLAFSPLWNQRFIKCVIISFKEPFGTEGRGGYFDDIGIIRDVMQNHLLQVLSLMAMEAPISLDAEAIRDEKVKVLKCIAPIEMEDVVLGQYVGTEDGEKPGYKDDDGVPEDSRTPTFCQATLRINNERWDGVPFIMKCGKAINERKANIRIQFKDQPGQLFKGADRNELVIRIQPNEAMYMKVTAKKPGLTNDIIGTDLDLTYASRYEDLELPGAYERLIFEVIRGDHSQFVRADELDAAWRIFTPLLHKIDEHAVEPLPYVYGSRGPDAADEALFATGYVRSSNYEWYSSDAKK